MAPIMNHFFRLSCFFGGATAAVSLATLLDVCIESSSETGSECLGATVIANLVRDLCRDKGCL